MTVFVSLPEEKKKKNPAQGSPLSSYGGGSDGTHGGFTGYLKLVYPRPTVAPIGIAPAGSGGGGPSFGGGGSAPSGGGGGTSGGTGGGGRLGGLRASLL